MANGGVATGVFIAMPVNIFGEDVPAIRLGAAGEV